MYIEDIFDSYNDDRLYSVIMDDDELRVFSDLLERLYAVKAKIPLTKTELLLADRIHELRMSKKKTVI